MKKNFNKERHAEGVLYLSGLPYPLSRLEFVEEMLQVRLSGRWSILNHSFQDIKFP
jgi:hypothetical protein